MITWHDTPSVSIAVLFVRGVRLARLHAWRDRWRIELAGGELTGSAGSLGDAKRCALEGMAEAVTALEHELRTTLVVRR